MSIGDYYPAMDSESCMSYGMTRGCDADCPALWAGSCESYSDVIPMVVDQLEADELSELVKIYFTPNERVEFIYKLIDSPTEKPTQNQQFKSIW